VIIFRPARKSGEETGRYSNEDWRKQEGDGGKIWKSDPVWKTNRFFCEERRKTANLAKLLPAPSRQFPRALFKLIADHRLSIFEVYLSGFT